MKIDIKNLKKNMMFFIVSIAILVVIVLLSAIFGSGGTNLDKVDLNNEDVNITGLVISEIMSSNNGVIVDEKGNLYDYVELYNGNDKAINLKNYGLSDEGEELNGLFLKLKFQVRVI